MSVSGYLIKVSSSPSGCCRSAGGHPRELTAGFSGKGIVRVLAGAGSALETNSVLASPSFTRRAETKQRRSSDDVAGSMIKVDRYQ